MRKIEENELWQVKCKNHNKAGKGVKGTTYKRRNVIINPFTKPAKANSLLERLYNNK